LHLALKLLYTEVGNLNNHHQCEASPGWCDGSHIVSEHHHTPAYWWRRDRVMKPIIIYGDDQEAMIIEENRQMWPGCRGYTPTLFFFRKTPWDL